MSYYRFRQSYKNRKPSKKGFFGLPKTKTKRVTHYNEATLELANPFRKATKAKRKKVNLKGIILPLLFAVWIGLMLYLPYFKVSTIAFSGLKVIKEQEIKRDVTDQFLTDKPLWPATNYFIVNEKAISEYLQNKYAFNDVNVKKSFPNTVQITLEEKSTSAIYDNGTAYYLVGNDGSIIKHIRNVNESEFALSTTTTLKIIATSSSSTVKSLKQPSTTTIYVTTTVKTHVPAFGEMLRDYGNLPLIYSMDNDSANSTSTVLTKDAIDGIISFYNALKRLKIVNSTYMTFTTMDGGMTVYTTEPWKIQFAPKNDINAQINNLQVILKNSHPTEYIDLRFGDRVYWK